MFVSPRSIGDVEVSRQGPGIGKRDPPAAAASNNPGVCCQPAG